MHQCIECRKERWAWKDCPRPLDFYPFAVIVFCDNHVRFLLAHYEGLTDGRWPFEGVEPLGYTGLNFRALYENPAMVLAELNTRLDIIKRDPKGYEDVTLALALAPNDMKAEALSILMHTQVYDLYARAERVIRFCRGRKVRTISYRQFINHG